MSEASLEPPYSVGLETTPQSCNLNSSPPTAYQRHRFDKYLPELNRIVNGLELSAMETGPTPAARTRAAKMARRLSDCCRYSQALCDEAAGEIVIAHHRCKSRLCPLCGRLRAQALRGRMTVPIRKLDSPRLLTLTLRSNDEPLREQVQRLNRCFAKLRRTDVWKHNFLGGLYVTEVTINPKTGRWHPHLHAIVDGRYVPQKDLAAAWLRSTGDSTIVDVRKAHSIKAAVNYLCTYVTKSQDASHVPDEKIGEWADAMHGLRMAATFGCLHGTKLEPEKEKMNDRLTDLCPIGALATAADRNEGDARELFKQVVRASERGLPNGEPAKVEILAAANRELIGRVRAWWARWQSPHDPDPAPKPRVGRTRSRVDQGALWKRENIGLADVEPLSGGSRLPF